jgi:hypothetical protein
MVSGILTKLAPSNKAHLTNLEGHKGTAKVA